MKLHELAPTRGAKHKVKRVGRGIGSGHGKTSCRGSKGQKARGSIRPGFEGGQTPLYMRMRKHRGRGKGAVPHRMFEKNYAITNVRVLQKLAEGLEKNPVLTPEKLLELGVIKNLSNGLRILGEGEIKLPLTIHAHHFSASARSKIEAAGGHALLMEFGKPAANSPASASSTSEGVN
jgi:large subunit ribosomal protein L15